MLIKSEDKTVFSKMKKSFLALALIICLALPALSSAATITQIYDFSFNNFAGDSRYTGSEWATGCSGFWDSEGDLRNRLISRISAE